VAVAVAAQMGRLRWGVKVVRVEALEVLEAAGLLMNGKAEVQHAVVTEE
jgi:hypothetical protein